jgi:hypothetical protein
MEEWLSGEGSDEYRRDRRGVKHTQIEWTALGNCFQSAPLWGSVDPFAMLADQILQPLHRFHFGNVEFHRPKRRLPSEKI